MFNKERSLNIYYIIIAYLINLCSSTVTVDQCSKWGISSTIIFGYNNVTGINDSFALNLSNSGLDINRHTNEIAILDDNNHRIFIFNQSNTSTLLAILSNSSNSTNKSISYSPSAIRFTNNSFYIFDSWNQQFIKMTYPLQYGENATIYNISIHWSSLNYFLHNGTVVGLGVDNTNEQIFISDISNNQILRSQISASNLYDIYITDKSIGNITYPLNNSRSIVMNSNRTLFVSDFYRNQILMFKYNARNATTLPINITDCIGLSLYSDNILVINTRNSVYLFNLTNNETKCAIGKCSNSKQLTDIRNALIDNNGSLIITNGSLIVSYPLYQKCTQNPNSNDSSKPFVPTDNCNSSDLFGIHCTSHRNICDQSQPCLNSGACILNTTKAIGYECNCAWGYQGINCEDDQRPCKPFTCFQRGNCVNMSLTDYKCYCWSGYAGEHCENRVDFCANITCQNQAVCFRQFLNFTCNCLFGYTGRYCEITESSTITRTYVRKSFGYVAIIMLASLVGFIVIMDMLKYVFGIDPVQNDRNILKKKRMRKYKKNKIEQPKTPYRFQYIS